MIPVMRVLIIQWLTCNCMIRHAVCRLLIQCILMHYRPILVCLFIQWVRRSPKMTPGTSCLLRQRNWLRMRRRETCLLTNTDHIIIGKYIKSGWDAEYLVYWPIQFFSLESYSSKFPQVYLLRPTSELFGSKIFAANNDLLNAQNCF